MKLYVVQRGDVYYSRMTESGMILYSEYLKNAHFFGESERGEAERFAVGHRCKLVEVSCKLKVVASAEDKECIST